MKWSDLSNDLQARIIKQDSASFGPGGIRPVQAKVTKPDSGREVKDRQLVRCKKSVAYRIKLIVVSRRRMDEHDNLRSACKPIVDAITESLGFRNDDDPALEWSYSQIYGRRDRND